MRINYELLKLSLFMSEVFSKGDNAATLATAIQKWFLVPLAREKSPRVSIFGTGSSHRRHDSTSFLEKGILHKFTYHTPGPRYLTAGELKDPRPAPPDNCAIEEKPRLYRHNSSGIEG